MVPGKIDGCGEKDFGPGTVLYSVRIQSQEKSEIGLGPIYMTVRVLEPNGHLRVCGLSSTSIGVPKGSRGRIFTLGRFVVNISYGDEVGHLLFGVKLYCSDTRAQAYVHSDFGVHGAAS